MMRNLKKNRFIVLYFLLICVWIDFIAHFLRKVVSMHSDQYKISSPIIALHSF